jgi:hypothetical protein
MASDVIYARDVIYGRAYPGPRGAQRHREIRGPAQNFAAQRLYFHVEDLDPGSARRLRHRLSGKRVHGRHLCGKRHLCERRHVSPCVPRTAWRAVPSRDAGSSTKICRAAALFSCRRPGSRICAAASPPLVRETRPRTSPMRKRHLCERRHVWSGVPRTAWRAAPSRDPGPSAKIAAQRLQIFLKNWIPDLRAGFASLAGARPGYEGVIYVKNVMYARTVIYVAGRRQSRALQHQYPDVVGITTRSRMQIACGSL